MGLLHLNNIHKLHNNIYIYKTLRKYHDTFFCFWLNLAAHWFRWCDGRRSRLRRRRHRGRDEILILYPVYLMTKTQYTIIFYNIPRFFLVKSPFFMLKSSFLMVDPPELLSGRLADSGTAATWSPCAGLRSTPVGRLVGGLY